MDCRVFWMKSRRRRENVWEIEKHRETELREREN
jgi:hypothetical protein